MWNLRLTLLPSALGAHSLNHWITREVLQMHFRLNIQALVSLLPVCVCVCVCVFPNGIEEMFLPHRRWLECTCAIILTTSQVCSYLDPGSEVVTNMRG